MMGQGFNDLDQAAVTAKERRERSFGVRRFFLDQGVEKDIIFIDDGGHYHEEHGNIKADGRWQETPCPGRENGCPWCLSGKNSHRIYTFTIVDCVYRDKKGNVHINQKKIFAIKPEAMLIFYQKIQAWGGLKHRQVRVSRVGQNSQSSGNGFELAMMNGQMIRPNFQQISSDPTFWQPFDYAQLYVPLPPQQLNMLYQKSLQETTAPTVSTGYPSQGQYQQQGQGQYPPQGQQAYAPQGQGQYPPQGQQQQPPQQEQYQQQPPQQQGMPQQGMPPEQQQPPQQSGGQAQPTQYQPGLDDIPF